MRQAKLLIGKLGYGHAFKKALLDWRNTPFSDGRVSPSEAMYGRTLRHRLPIVRETKGNPQKLPESMFKPGQRVRVQDPKTRRWNQLF